MLASLGVSIICLPACLHIILTPDTQGTEACPTLRVLPGLPEVAWSDVTTSDIQLELTLKRHLQETVALGVVLLGL